MEAVLGLRIMSNTVNSLDRAIDRRTCAAGQLVKLVKPEPKEGVRGKRIMMELTGEWGIVSASNPPLCRKSTTTLPIRMRNETGGINHTPCR